MDMNQVTQMAKTIKSAKNPQLLLNQMMNNNPQVKQVLNQYGGDAKTAFYKVAEEKGVNPTEIINLLK